DLGLPFAGQFQIGLRCLPRLLDETMQQDHPALGDADYHPSRSVAEKVAADFPQSATKGLAEGHDGSNPFGLYGCEAALSRVVPRSAQGLSAWAVTRRRFLSKQPDIAKSSDWHPGTLTMTTLIGEPRLCGS